MFERTDIRILRSDGRAYTGSGNECSFRSETVSCETAEGFKISARLLPDSPLMKAQSGFSRDCAVQISLPVEDACFLAIYQHKEWWQRPTFADCVKDIPKRTQLLMWRHEGEYHVLLAVCGSDYRSDMHGENGVVVFTLSSNKDGMMQCESAVCAYAYGQDPYKTCENAVKLSIRLSLGNGKLRNNKRYPDVFDYFGWCTWDAFYHNVNHEGIAKKITEFQENKLPLRWILIDDGWSKADYAKQELEGLDASEDKFPGGIGEIVRRVKSEGVAHVGVWQAAMGYWNGIKSGSEVHLELNENLLRLPDERLVPNPDKSFDFWNAWHSRLAKQGVDFVKIDEQSAPAMFYAGTHSYGESSRKTQDGLGASAGLSFDGNAIHCMGMAPQEIWSRSSAAIIRTSDDFVPNNLHGFAEHCMQNAYCSLLTGQMYWGDWDMFWSKGDKSWQHSMLRAVSGGPVYVSDKIGEINPQTIWPLINKTGKLLRCKGIGLPTADCLLQNPFSIQKPMKIWNKYNDAFLVAAFAGDDSDVSGSLKLEELSGVGDNEYIWYDWSSEKSGILDEKEELKILIKAGGSAIYLLVPKQEVCTPLGIVDKYLSCSMIRDVWRDNKNTVVALKEGGRFGCWIDEKQQLQFFDCAKTEKPVVKINMNTATVSLIN